MLTGSMENVKLCRTMENVKLWKSVKKTPVVLKLLKVTELSNILLTHWKTCHFACKNFVIIKFCQLVEMDRNFQKM